MTLLAEGTQELTLTRVRGLDTFLRLEPAWTSLQQRVPDATVFSTWQWNAPAARHFARDRLDVRVLEQDGATVAIAPLARRRCLGQRTLVLLGSGLDDYSMGDYGDMLLAAGCECAALEALVADLDSDGGWEQVWLQELPESSQTALILPVLARQQGWHVDIRDASDTYTVDLPATADEYLARLSQNTRKALRRRWNKLSREHEAAYRTVAPHEDPLSAFDTLVDLHTRRWRHEGQGGIFKRDAVRAFHREAVRELHAAGMVDLTLLEAQGKAIAGQYCLDFNGRRLFYINGHEPASEWQSYGLGFITDVARVEAAIASGLTTADFGRSEGEYKARYAVRRQQNLHLRIFRSRAAYLRCSLYLAAREAAKPTGKRLLGVMRRRRAGGHAGAAEDEA